MIRGFIAFLFIWVLLYFGFVGVRAFVKTDVQHKISLLKCFTISGLLAILASVVLTFIVIIF